MCLPVCAGQARGDPGGHARMAGRHPLLHPAPEGQDAQQAGKRVLQPSHGCMSSVERDVLLMSSSLRAGQPRRSHQSCCREYARGWLALLRNCRCLVYPRLRSSLASELITPRIGPLSGDEHGGGRPDRAIWAVRGLGAQHAVHRRAQQPQGTGSERDAARDRQQGVSC